MDELISFFDAENADEMPAELPPEVIQFYIIFLVHRITSYNHIFVC